MIALRPFTRHRRRKPTTLVAGLPVLIAGAAAIAVPAFAQAASASSGGGNGPDTYNGLGAVVSWTEQHVTPHALLATQYAPASGGGPGGPPPAAASDLTDAVPVLGAPATTAVVRPGKIGN